jgi:hypothetical protein
MATKKVKLTTPRVLGNGQTQDHGDVIDVDRREAARLVEAGQAVPVEDPSNPPPASDRPKK